MMRGRNQWSGRPRCGVTITRGPRKGEPCGKIASERVVGARLVCRYHYGRKDKKTPIGGAWR